ncbi:ST1A2-like protein, partial [Mya arenaria]
MYSFTERRRQEDVPGGDTVLYDVDDVTNYRLPTFGNTFEEANRDVKVPCMPEGNSEASMNAIPSPRIINTHVKIRYMLKDAKRKRLKCIFVLRNPKDVAVSFYNHTVNLSMFDYTGKFENFFQMFMRGETEYWSYPEYLLEWQQFITENPDWPIHIMYYENMKTVVYIYKKYSKIIKQIHLYLTALKSCFHWPYQGGYPKF